MRWIARHYRNAQSLRKNMKLTALACGGWSCGAARALATWREEGFDGLRRGLAVLAAQKELRPEDEGFDPTDYQEWTRRYDSLDARALQRLRRRAAALRPSAGLNGSDAPAISLILLPGAGDCNFLDQTLRSLRAQIFTDWELLAAPVADFPAAARMTLERHAGEDSRIRLLAAGTWPQGMHDPADMAAAALKLAAGAHTGFLHADDELPAHALLCAALTLRQRPHTALLYADEDRLGAAGERRRPWFKPDSNPELMLAQDMFSGLCLLRTAEAAAAGGPRQGFGPWMVFDLAWRVMERATPAAVVHVPRILCHRREALNQPPGQASDKASGQTSSQPVCQTLAPGLRAVQEHLDRMGGHARAVPAPGLPGFIRILHDRPGPERRVSILIPTRDRADLLATCVRSILDRTEHKGYEIVVIDNGSVEQATHQLFDALRGEGVRIVRDDAPFNYSRLNNNGAAAATGEFLCLMNNDIEVIGGDWLGEMLSFAQRPDVGCVGARLWYPDGTLQHGGIVRGLCGFAGHAHLGLAHGEAGYFGRALLHQELSAVTAACLLVRREIFDTVGGLDEALPESYNDVDFCLRVRAAGYRNVWTPYAELYHHESASRRNRTQNNGAAMNEQERRTTRLMRTRWGALAEDPAYNPNLTRRSCGFGLAWPPRVPPLSLL